MCLDGMCLLIITTDSIILTGTITTTDLTMGLITGVAGGKASTNFNKNLKTDF